MEYPATAATVETLPNGLTLILDPDPAAPVVSAQIWVATGSMHEDAHLGGGISHFLEHMVFKGTRDFDADNLADTVQAAGGHWNAYTSFDRTVYYIDGPAASLPVFLKTLTNLVFFPILPESEFEKEKDVIRREIDMGLDDPDNAASRLLFSTVFAHDPRRHPVIGHRHLFDAIRHQDLTEYHRARYTPDRCFAVISGDFDPEEARKMAAELTAGCLPGGGRDPLVARRIELERIVRDHRADRPRVHPPVRRGGDGALRARRGDGGDARLDAGGEFPGECLRLACHGIVTGAPPMSRDRLQAAPGPEIVPVVEIVRAEVFRAESGGQQSAGGGALPRQPVHPLAQRVLHFLSRTLARQFRVAGDDPEHLPVRVPLAFL